MNDGNRKRVFSSILSIDAWHKPLKNKKNSSSVFVELSFHEGRIGGDDADLPLTFKISLKRALLTISVENPLRIEKSSIARNIPKNDANLTRIITAKSEIDKSSNLSYGIDLKKFALLFSGKKRNSLSISDEEALKIVSEIPRILARAKPVGSLEYGWELLPSYERSLDGQPWDPIKNPRLNVLAPSSDRFLDSAIKINVSCNREDIEISDIKVKDENLRGRISGNILGDINEKAAIQHIKLLLSEADLHPGRLDNRFSSILIADVLSQEE